MRESFSEYKIMYHYNIKLVIKKQTLQFKNITFNSLQSKGGAWLPDKLLTLLYWSCDMHLLDTNRLCKCAAQAPHITKLIFLSSVHIFAYNYLSALAHAST